MVGRNELAWWGGAICISLLLAALVTFRNSNINGTTEPSETIAPPSAGYHRDDSSEGNGNGLASIPELFDKANAAVNRGDYETAKRIVGPLAAQDNARAQAFVGMMHEQGWGFTQDYAEAMRWYRRAADQGYAAAQLSIGLMYRDGQGAPQDYVQAYLWLKLAAQQNAPPDASGHAIVPQLAATALEFVASRMSAAQLAEANKLISKGWRPEAASGSPAASGELRFN